MNFHLPGQMLVLFPKRQLAVYKDNTMPRVKLDRYESPSCERLPARSVCAAEFPKPKASRATFIFNGVRRAAHEQAADRTLARANGITG